jgi:multiple sugar transport system substrate-binding protein
MQMRRAIDVSRVLLGDPNDGKRSCLSPLMPWSGAQPDCAPSLLSQSPPTGSESQITKIGSSVPPRVVAPCAPASCPFKGQQVTVIVSGGKPIGGPIHELQQEYEEATGAKLNIVDLTVDEPYATFLSDVTNHVGHYDVSIAGAWWLGEFVESGFVVPYDKFYDDPRFPRWNIEDVLPAPRSLLTYGGHKYMVANDHDGQVMYYRRDLLEDPRHRAAFQKSYGYPLDAPRTWKEFRDVAEYFNGKDLIGDGTPGSGLTLALKVGSQGMFHFMSLSAPFVIGPANPKLYWFDPQTMKPLIESPGHVRALQTLVDLVKFGPKDMLDWDLGAGWDYFLSGHAALTFTWGDLGGLAEQEGSRVKGKLGAAPMPSTSGTAIPSPRCTPDAELRRQHDRGSWSGVISRYSKSPEAAYYLLVLMANKDKSYVYAARGWDGSIPPGSPFPRHPTAIGSSAARAWAGTRKMPSCWLHMLNPSAIRSNRTWHPGAFSYWQAMDVHPPGGRRTPVARASAEGNSRRLRGRSRFGWGG